MAKTEKTQGKFYIDPDVEKILSRIVAGDKSKFINEAIREYAKGVSTPMDSSLISSPSMVGIVCTEQNASRVRLPRRVVFEQINASKNKFWVEPDKEHGEGDRKLSLFVCENQSDLQDIYSILPDIVSFVVAQTDSGIWFQADPAYTIKALPPADAPIVLKAEQLLLVHKALVRAHSEYTNLGTKYNARGDEENGNHSLEQAQKFVDLRNRLESGEPLKGRSHDAFLVVDALHCAEVQCRNSKAMDKAAQFASLRRSLENKS